MNHIAVKIIIIVLAVFGLLHLVDFAVNPPTQPAPHQCPIPDVWQMQTILEQQGYDLGEHGIDGKLGCADSNTQKSLRLYWNTQYAERSMNPRGVPE